MVINKDEQQSHLQFNDVLIDAIGTLQHELTEGISEYALISLLQAEPFHLFDEGCLSDSNTLFKTHFILFHCLYRLQQQYMASGVGFLEVHTLCIKLCVFDDNKAQRGLSKEDSLATYYLDWSNYKTTDKEIDDLLASFWERFISGNQYGDRIISEEEITTAKQRLKIPIDADMDKAMLKKQYRKALQQSHPDKGGSKDDAQAVIMSYKLLLQRVTVVN